MPAFVHDDSFRALEIVDRVPAGCLGVLVTHADFKPHLRRGETAIIDTADTVAQHGELYAIRIHALHRGRPTTTLAIVQAFERGFDLWCRYSFKTPGSLPPSDGPFTAEGWRQNCAGRITGAKPAARQRGA